MKVKLQIGSSVRLSLVIDYSMLSLVAIVARRTL